MNKDLIETHGKIEGEVKEKFEPTLLEQVWGVDNQSRYGTEDEDVYASRIKEMTRSDLEAHARHVGVVVVEHSPRLRDKLLGEFRSYISLTYKPQTTANSDNKNKYSDAVQKIMSEGR